MASKSVPRNLRKQNKRFGKHVFCYFFAGNLEHLASMRSPKRSRNSQDGSRKPPRAFQKKGSIPSWPALSLCWLALDLLWAMLSSSWPFLGLSWAILGLSWAILDICFGLRWPKEGKDGLQKRSKKTKKAKTSILENMCVCCVFYMEFGTSGLHESPKMVKKPPKTAPGSLQEPFEKRVHPALACFEPMLARHGPVLDHAELVLACLGSVLGHVGPVLGHLGHLFWAVMAQNKPRWPPRAFQES